MPAQTSGYHVDRRWRDVVSDDAWAFDCGHLRFAVEGRHDILDNRHLRARHSPVYDAKSKPRASFPETLTREAGLFSSGHVENLIASDDKRFVITTAKGGAGTLSVVLTTRGGFTRAATPFGSDVQFFIEALASTNASQQLVFNLLLQPVRDDADRPGAGRSGADAHPILRRRGQPVHQPDDPRIAGTRYVDDRGDAGVDCEDRLRRLEDHTAVGVARALRATLEVIPT